MKSFRSKTVFIDDENYGPAAMYSYSSSDGRFVQRYLINRETTADDHYTYKAHDDLMNIDSYITIRRDTLEGNEGNQRYYSCQIATRDEIKQTLADYAQYTTTRKNKKDEQLKKNEI
jgi:hypothetical protein